MTNYEQGFLTKCAELGVPEQVAGEMLKVAVNSPAGEVLRTIPGGIAMGATPVTSALSGVPSIVGTIKGYTDKGDDYGEMSNYIPGEASYNWSRRRKRVAKEMLKKDPKSHPYANIAAEHFGPLTSTLAAGGAGALLGAAIGGATGKGAGQGAGIGAIAGGSAANLASLIGTIRGMAKKRRSDDEQLSKETKGRAIAKYLVPGLATEDALMRIGKSRDYFKEDE